MANAYSWGGISDWQPTSTFGRGGTLYFSPSTGQRSYFGGGGNAISVTSYSGTSGDMYGAMEAAMAEQAAAQAKYMKEMSALQQQQLLLQQNAAAAADVESGKNAGDFTVANADDVARKQLLRRGLMSTYTRYGQASGQKTAKLGG